MITITLYSMMEALWYINKMTQFNNDDSYNKFDKKELIRNNFFLNLDEDEDDLLGDT